MLGVVLLAASSFTHAQVFTPVPAERDRVPGWVFTPRFAIGGAWDDNLMLAHPDDDPPADYGTPLRPSATLDFTGKRTEFSTGYSGSLMLYQDLDELSSYEQHLRASLEYRANERLTFLMNERFSMAPTTDVIPLSGGVPFYRVGSSVNAVDGGFVAMLTRRVRVGGSYTFRTVDFEFDELLGRELRGGSSHELDFSIDRPLSARWTIGGEYSFDRVSVAPGTIAEGPDDRFNIQSGGFTTAYTLSPAVSVTGGFGIAHLGAGLTHESRTAPQWRAGVTYQLPRALLAASYSRSYVPAFGFGGTLQNEEWSGAVIVPFARRRAYLEGGLSWFNNEDLEPDEPKLRSSWLTAKVGYRVTRWLNVEGYYARADQDTHRAGGRLSRNQIGFQVVTWRPLKIR
jgi:hypothetical protein